MVLPSPPFGLSVLNGAHDKSDSCASQSPIMRTAQRRDAHDDASLNAQGAEAHPGTL